MQNNLIEISHDNLIGIDELGCNLFNINGDVIYPKGQKVDAGVLLRLKYTRMFRRINESINSEKSIPDIPEYNELYFSKANFDLLNQVLDKNKGVLLISGGNNAGKTTTAYSIINHLKYTKRISTLENFIKHKVPGVIQSQEDPTNFKKALIDIIKNKPNVLLVRDICDRTIGDLVLDTALANYQVIATIKSDRALQSLRLLDDVGIERSSQSASINGILAQKLVHRICDNCKEKYKIPVSEASKYFLCSQKAEVFFYRGKGCSKCNNTGYSGMLPVQEIIVINDELRRIIANNASINEINNYINNKGFQDMKYDLLKKILRGLTTIDEYINF